MAIQAQPIMRKGKTQRDHASGAWARRKTNMQMRTDWMNDSRATVATFPRQCCNGKKNRHRGMNN